MKYKLSKFGRLFKTGNIWIGFWGPESMIFTIEVEDKKIEQYLYLFKARRGVDIPLNLLDKFSDLIKLGFLLPFDKDESFWVESVRSLVRQANDETLKLTLLPTENCNFDCVYCFEEKRPLTMNKDLIISIKKFAERNFENYSNIEISWYGGEPLLTREVIIELQDFFIKKARELKKSIRSNITTNGYLLSKELFINLVDLGINLFQITLDGPPSIHNFQRPLKSGKPTYDKILQNLLDIKGVNLDFKIFLRINFYLENTSIISKFICDDLQSNFSNDKRFIIGFYPISSENTISLKDLVLERSGKGEIEATIELLKRAAECKLTIPIENFYGLMSGACFAGFKNSFIIGADGTIYKCPVDFKFPLNKIGKLARDGTMIIDEKLLKMWTRNFNNFEKCKDCFFLFQCGGLSCPLKTMKTGVPYCPVTKDLIPAWIDVL